MLSHTSFYYLHFLIFYDEYCSYIQDMHFAFIKNIKWVTNYVIPPGFDFDRVPRTLLPGVRSSRLRDRQKEEREFQVKQAFIEDMLQENKLLSTLLGKEATEQVVLWNADLLPDSGKYRQLPDLASTSGTYTVDTSNDNISSADKSSHCLLDEMNLYMENLTDFDVGCDDLPCHFQTDSGALVCVGCGILGFPFMAVIQPTEKLIMELLHDNHRLVEDSSLNSVASLHGVVSSNAFILCTIICVIIIFSHVGFHLCILICCIGSSM